MKDSNRHLEVFKIVGIYALIGSLWIYYSDSAVAFLVNDHNLLARIGILKGLLFIVLTSLLLYLLIKQNFLKYRQIERSLSKSREQYRRLTESLSGISWEFNIS